MTIVVPLLLGLAGYVGVPTCRTVYEEKCWEVPRRECTNIPTPVTTTELVKDCYMDYDRSCRTTFEDKIEYVNGQECHTVQVPKVERVPEEKCNDVPEDICETEYEEECTNEYEQECETKTDQECKNEYTQECSYKVKEVCE